MTDDLLFSSIAKIDRAKKHLTDLKARISVYHRRDPYRIVSDRNSEPGYELYRFEFVEPIPTELGSIVGDIVHNLRSALDTLATSLVISNGKTSSSIIKKTYFPISSTKELFDKKLANDLRGASPDARKMVRRLKPYKGGTDAFWRLHQLDILDKHTVLIPVGASHSRIDWKISFVGMFEGMGVTDLSQIPELKPVSFNTADTQYPLKHGDVVFKYGFGPDKEGKNKGDFKFAIDIAFGEGQIVDGQPVVPSLQQFVDFVERVVNIFAKRYFKIT